MGASARPRGGGAAAKDLEKEDHDVLRDEARGSVSVPWTLAPPRVRRHKMLGPSGSLHDGLYALFSTLEDRARSGAGSRGSDAHHAHDDHHHHFISIMLIL